MKNEEAKVLVEKVEEQAVTIANQKKEIEELNQKIKELEKQLKEYKQNFVVLHKEFAQAKMQLALMEVPDNK
jgi:phage-related tail protein